MKKLVYLIPILFLLFSCDKGDDLYYSFDTNFGLEITDMTGKDLLENDLVVDKITLSGNNTGAESPTAGLLTPDVPPLENHSVKRRGSVNVLHLTFDPIYSESVLIIKWKDISEPDTLTAELYNKNNKVYPSKIFWNGTLIWTEGQSGNKNSIKIVKDL